MSSRRHHANIRGLTASRLSNPNAAAQMARVASTTARGRQPDQCSRHTNAMAAVISAPAARLGSAENRRNISPAAVG